MYMYDKMCIDVCVQKDREEYLDNSHDCQPYMSSCQHHAWTIRNKTDKNRPLEYTLICLVDHISKSEFENECF